MNELEKLLVEREITRRLVDYCVGIDTCDVELTASAYHVASVDDHGSFKGTGRAFAEYAATSLLRFEATQHTIGIPTIDVIDETSATAITYVEARHVLREDNHFSLITFGGEYRDRFEFHDGSWRIVHRLVVHSWDKTEPMEKAFDPERFVNRKRHGN